MNYLQQSISQDSFSAQMRIQDKPEESSPCYQTIKCKETQLLLSQRLLKDSKIFKQSLQKHKYASEIQSISNQIISDSFLRNLETKSFKKDEISSRNHLKQYQNNQEDGNQSLSPQNLKSNSALDKRQRNKQSAKQSRYRKKLYIQMLEEKQKVLTKKLLSKKKQLEETKNYLDRVINQNKAMSGFTASRHQMLKNLQNVLQEKTYSQEEKDREINKIIDNLRYRIGAAGKERISTINEYFRQIVNLSLPALHRYMMWSATEQNHLFSQNQQEESDDWYKQLKNSLNLTEEQKKEVQSKKTFLQEQKKVLEKLIGKLKNIKTQIEEKSIQLQDLIDQIRLILTPIQCANFILFIEKNKYRKELNLCDQLQQEKANVLEPECEDAGPVKMVKTDCN